MSLMLRAFGRLCPEIGGLDFRIVGRLHQLENTDSTKQIVAGNGFKMAGDTSNAAYISGINERPLMRRLAAKIRRGSTVYDVGANIGYTALWVAKACQSEVIAFEPEPGTFERLQRNASLNPGLAVRCENLALGAEDTAAELYSVSAGDGAASLSRRPGISGVPIRIARLDGLALKAPDWLIIDVEGHGAGVVAGAAETIQRCTPGLAVEIHSDEEFDGISALLPRSYRLAESLTTIWGRHVFWEVAS